MTDFFEILRDNRLYLLFVREMHLSRLTRLPSAEWHRGVFHGVAVRHGENQEEEEGEVEQEVERDKEEEKSKTSAHVHGWDGMKRRGRGP